MGNWKIKVDEENGIDLTPGFGADSQQEIGRFIPADILNLYEVHSYKHAAAILHNSYPDELKEILAALRQFRLTTDDILKPGGNESDIPKRISSLLRPLGWHETRIKGDLLITMAIHQESESGSGKKQLVLQQPIKRDNYLDGHEVDYVKKGVAFDLEWNSKDQTFDRDLYASGLFLIAA